MNPKPFSSLNHLTVPVAMCSLPGAYVLRNAGGAKATTTNAGTEIAGQIARHDEHQCSSGQAPHKPWQSPADSGPAARRGVEFVDRGRQGAGIDRMTGRLRSPLIDVATGASRAPRAYRPTRGCDRRCT